MAMTSVDPPAQPRNMRPRLLWLIRMAPLSCCAVVAAALRTVPCSRSDRFSPSASACAPLFTSSIVLGSALGVLPIAAISDRIDRRLVIAAVLIGGAASETALSRVTAPGAWLLVLGFLVGLTTYSLYTLAVSLANDHGAPHDLSFIAVGLLFIYCVAAIAAPALASVLMKDFGPRMLFIRTPTCTWRSRRSPFGGF
jgi:MFS family permease